MASTSTTENMALVRRLLEEGFGRADRQILGEVLAADFIGHAPAEPGHDAEKQDREHLAEEIERAHAGLANLEFSIQDMIAQDDRVAVRSTIRGRHDGEFMGAPPTGEQVEFAAMNVFRIENGEIAEDWALWDAFGLLSQLGMLPDGPPE